jgi:ATP adenylyltransferase
MSYIDSGHDARPRGCVFCDALAAEDDVDALILHRGERAFIILNLYPYNSGHAMVVPFAHAPSYEDVDAATRAELFELLTLFTGAARAVLRCHGFNAGMNIGALAGAGVAEHLHLHVVPRWSGDANFMPILAGTTVMPELLPVTYARLRGEIERILAERGGAVAQAGALVVLPAAGRLVMRRAGDGRIVVPKGHIEAGENAAQAAVREIHEETGYRATLTGWAGAIAWEQPVACGGAERRHSSFFLATGEPTGDTAAHLERDTVLLTLEEALAAVTIPSVRDLLRQATPGVRRMLGGGA